MSPHGTVEALPGLGETAAHEVAARDADVQARDQHRCPGEAAFEVLAGFHKAPAIVDGHNGASRIHPAEPVTDFPHAFGELGLHRGATPYRPRGEERIHDPLQVSRGKILRALLQLPRGLPHDRCHEVRAVHGQRAVGAGAARQEHRPQLLDVVRDCGGHVFHQGLARNLQRGKGECDVRQVRRFEGLYAGVGVLGLVLQAHVDVAGQELHESSVLQQERPVGPRYRGQVLRSIPLHVVGNHVTDLRHQRLVVHLRHRQRPQQVRHVLALEARKALERLIGDRAHQRRGRELAIGLRERPSDIAHLRWPQAPRQLPQELARRRLEHRLVCNASLRERVDHGCEVGRLEAVDFLADGHRYCLVQQRVLHLERGER
mmetsp:Transcript_21495/g.59622  ORF Transcript_21495/g.59622 Transcript_21495/m.59622 type:complete len:374 (-) Transcript_21495:650-1771(-)